MVYPQIPDFARLTNELKALAGLKAEYRAQGIEEPLARLEQAFRDAHAQLAALPDDAAAARQEPNDLPTLRYLRPEGPRRLWTRFDAAQYAERVEGALLARCAGCTLGAIVEGWPVHEMEAWAQETGTPFPPTDYWRQAKTPSSLRYATDRCDAYTRDGLQGVPVDDDLIYTQLGLLLFEEYGGDFTTEHVGQLWDRYLFWVWEDMRWPLERFRQGAPALQAAEGNPWQQMICAFIRCDPYGYVAPGQPELAATLSYRDGLMSHRRNGLYGGMFFAAAIAAALAVDDPIEALRIGLTEIPRDCRLAQEVRWALEVGKGMHNYRDARAAVDERFAGMHPVHTINNACLVVFGLMIGGADVTRVLSETVAMGLDNDCTAATAGSIVGAVVGKTGVPAHWTARFGDRMRSYIKGHPEFSISDMVARYTRQAERLFGLNG